MSIQSVLSLLLEGAERGYDTGCSGDTEEGRTTFSHRPAVDGPFVGDDQVDADVVWVSGKGSNDLFFVGESDEGDLLPQTAEEPVVIAAAVSDPVSRPVKRG